MDEQIARIEKEIAAMEGALRHHKDNVIAFENAIAISRAIVAMLRDGTPLPSEQQQEQGQPAELEGNEA